MARCIYNSVINWNDGALICKYIFSMCSAFVMELFRFNGFVYHTHTRTQTHECILTAFRWRHIEPNTMGHIWRWNNLWMPDSKDYFMWCFESKSVQSTYFGFLPLVWCWTDSNLSCLRFVFGTIDSGGCCIDLNAMSRKKRHHSNAIQFEHRESKLNYKWICHEKHSFKVVTISLLLLSWSSFLWSS